MVGWHHWLGGYESGQAPEVGDGQGGLACCSPQGCKESDMSEWLNWTDKLIACLKVTIIYSLIFIYVLVAFYFICASDSGFNIHETEWEIHSLKIRWEFVTRESWEVSAVSALKWWIALFQIFRHPSMKYLFS